MLKLFYIYVCTLYVVPHGIQYSEYSNKSQSRIFEYFTTAKSAANKGSNCGHVCKNGIAFEKFLDQIFII